MTNKSDSDDREPRDYSISHADAQEMYGEEYYAKHLGGVPYQRNEPHWLKFFGDIAESVVRALNPRTVLDVGCAMGFLVEAFRQRGVHAYGIDISEYAISQVIKDTQPFCRVASATEPLPSDFPNRYDLITCIEVLEHLPEHDARIAITNMASKTECILFSSTPHDFEEPTHVNVQPVIYWLQLFAEHDFYPDLRFDASHISPQAFLLRQGVSLPRLREDVLPFFAASIDRTFRALAAKDTHIGNLEGIRRQLEEALAAKDRLIAHLEEALAAKDRLIAHLEVSRGNLEQALAEQQAHLRTLEAEYERAVQALHRQLAETQQRLHALETSLGWKLQTRVRQLRMRFAPPASRRERVWQLGIRFLRAWLDRGLLTAVRERVTRLWRQPVWLGPDAPATQTERLSDQPHVGYALPLISYQAWIAENEPSPSELAAQRLRSPQLPYRPLISIVTPVYNPPPPILLATLESVANQTYDNWELCVVDGASDTTEVRDILTDNARKDRRVRVKCLDHNLGIAGNSNEALRLATGEFVALLDHDDLLAPNALFEIASALNENPSADIMYFDEDKLTPDGTERLEPFFKPDWSPELLLSANYMAHCVIRRRLLDGVGGFHTTTDGAQDWDLVLRCTERTQAILHIPKVLYHWRQVAGSTAGNYSAKPYVFDNQLRCVENHLRRQGIPEVTASFSSPGVLRVVWPARGLKVSVIIPTKDKLELLRRCLTSLLEKTQYPGFEVVLVDTGSCEAQTRNYYASLATEPRIRIIDHPGTFNYSAANNLGARHATGDLLLFLNNDIEILEPNWLEEMARWAERPEVGAVGAKLLYPDGRIQHAGVVLGMEGHASHVFWGAREQQSGPFGSVDWYRNYTAITGACMMMRRDVFDAVGGFDEGYQMVFSDVELCLRIVNKGYRIVYTPFARLRHYEGGSRGQHIPDHDILKGYEHTKEIVEAGDRFFNPNLSYSVRMPTLAWRGEETRADRLRRIALVNQGDVTITPDHPQDSLPYQELFHRAAAVGKGLHRDDIYGSGPPNDAPNPEVLSLLIRYGKAPVLDVGCGIGPYIAALQERGISSCGLETNADYVNRAKTLNRNVQLYDGKIIPFPDCSFDTVIAIEVLEHISDWENALREMLRVARRCVLISVPNIGVIPSLSRHQVVPWHLLEATHVSFFTVEILSRRLNSIPGITSNVFTYGSFQINGEIYHNHIFAVIHKLLIEQ
jgi:GT2 family glycosyltransferase/2-polyprenyl-3-methyl-5-hydroxy-6-metoxy-1,4-benzoquinol methylase